MFGLTPVPAILIIAVGVSRSSELIRSVAALPPTDVGAKVRVTVQFDPAVMVGVRLPQGTAPPGATLNMAASVPAVAMELTLRSALPVLAMVTCWAGAAWLTRTEPNSNGPGVTEMFGLTPAPDMFMMATGVSPSFELIRSVADLAPTDVGEKVTVRVQFAAGISVIGYVVPHVPPATLNMAASVPAKAIELITRSAVPVFVIVTICGADV
jgi:hypothetical protein